MDSHFFKCFVMQNFKHSETLDTSYNAQPVTQHPDFLYLAHLLRCPSAHEQICNMTNPAFVLCLSNSQSPIRFFSNAVGDSHQPEFIQSVIGTVGLHACWAFSGAAKFPSPLKQCNQKPAGLLGRQASACSLSPATACRSVSSSLLCVLWVEFLFCLASI